jgi:3-oxoacyl-[acyl-carrier protein] reductase
MNFGDLRVAVTGAASGLGRHFTLALAELGATVVAMDSDAAGLAKLSAEAPGSVRARHLDVRDEAQVTKTVAEMAGELGGLNGLVNNAGIYRDGRLVTLDDDGPRKMSLNQWRAVIDTDLTGPFLLGREVAAQMICRGIKPGVIINISSIMRHGNAGQSNYSAAKAGVAALTKVWAEELAPHGIRVATIAPGFVRTPILSRTDPTVLAQWIQRVPLRRLGEPAEIFAALRFAIECDFFTGKCLEVDGGLSV